MRHPRKPGCVTRRMLIFCRCAANRGIEIRLMSSLQPQRQAALNRRCGYALG
jgi:hypothetical protein